MNMAKYAIYIDETIQGSGLIEIDPSKLQLNNKFKFSSEHQGQLNSDDLLQNDYLLVKSEAAEGSGVRELYFKTV